MHTCIPQRLSHLRALLASVAAGADAKDQPADVPWVDRRPASHGRTSRVRRFGAFRRPRPPGERRRGDPGATCGPV